MTGPAINLKSAERVRRKRTQEKINKPFGQCNPELSIHNRLAEHAVSEIIYDSCWQIDLKLRVYKIELAQKLQPNDHNLCRVFIVSLLRRNALSFKWVRQ